MTYETHENPDVLQREWVEAVAAKTIAAADYRRRATEARNAESNLEAAAAIADELEERYLAARDAYREAAGITVPKPAAVAAKKPVLAPAKADGGPSL